MKGEVHTARAQVRRAFLDRYGWKGVRPIALPSDASLRRYFRLVQGNERALLMDSPSEHGEKPAAFVQIAEHLRSNGFRTPRIYASDIDRGLLLIEDFGENSFTRLLEGGEEARTLYEDALSVLIALQHKRLECIQVDLAHFDAQAAVDEVMGFVDWYYSVLEPVGLAAARRSWQACWSRVFHDLPVLPETLVLRDCHVDNLMRLSDSAADNALSRCGLLDFQDAVLGSPAYDVVSLLEDARRDLPPALRSSLLEEYLRATEPDIAREDFLSHYDVWSAQRHARVLGTFARLSRERANTSLCVHMPRVVGFLSSRLSCSRLAPVRSWFERFLPDLCAHLLQTDFLVKSV